MSVVKKMVKNLRNFHIIICIFHSESCNASDIIPSETGNYNSFIKEVHGGQDG